MKKLRIVFMGTPELAKVVLHSLLSGPDEVAAVVCQPDRPRGRGKKLSPPPVKVLAEEHKIPVLQPERIKGDAFLRQMEALRPDVLVVAAYGKILPQALLDLPPLGAINVHGSLLPKFRGAAPIQWALINGEQETGITIMQMDVGMDTGAILLPAALPITDEDTAGTLFDKVADLGGTTLLKAMELLKEDRLPPIIQDGSLATEAPMLSKEDGHLDWSRKGAHLHCLIRGLDPWPSAYTFLDSKRYRIFSPQLVVGEVSEAPGTIVRADKQGLLIATGENYLLIHEIQPEGKKRMDISSLLCGTSLESGQRFS